MKNEMTFKIIFLIMFMIFYNCKNKEAEKALFEEEKKILAKRMNKAVPKNYRERLSAKTFPRDSVIKVQEEIRINFIQEFPNSALSTDLVYRNKIDNGKVKTQKMFDLLTREQQNSKKGKLISRYLELNVGVKIHDQFIDFEMENSQGEKKKISKLRGKYTLIEFWASWCLPCRESNKYWVQFYEEYKSKGLQIIGISLDNNKYKWTDAIRKDKLIWENLSELNGRENTAALIYNVNGIPDNILIGPNGKIIARDLQNPVLIKETLEIIFDEKHENKLPFLITQGKDTVIYIEKKKNQLVTPYIIYC